MVFHSATSAVSALYIQVPEAPVLEYARRLPRTWPGRWSLPRGGLSPCEQVRRAIGSAITHLLHPAVVERLVSGRYTNRALGLCHPGFPDPFSPRIYGFHGLDCPMCAEAREIESEAVATRLGIEGDPGNGNRARAGSAPIVRTPTSYLEVKQRNETGPATDPRTAPRSRDHECDPP